jgi:serine/threonine protein kinase
VEAQNCERVALTETHDARDTRDTHRKLRGHENVVQVVGYCVVGDQKQIAMEYCAYGNLHECIQNVKRKAGARGLGRAARRKTEKGRELEAAMRSTRRSRGTPSASPPPSLSCSLTVRSSRFGR